MNVFPRTLCSVLKFSSYALYCANGTRSSFDSVQQKTVWTMTQTSSVTFRRLSRSSLAGSDNPPACCGSLVYARIRFPALASRCFRLSVIC